MVRTNCLYNSVRALFIVSVVLICGVGTASNTSQEALSHGCKNNFVKTTTLKTLDSAEFKFSALMPENFRQKDIVSAYGSSHSWIARTKDGYVYEIAVTKYSSFIQKTTKSFSEQETKLQETINGFFTNMETKSNCDIVSKNLNRKYKIKGSPAAEYRFSARTRTRRMPLAGKAVFCANRNMDYIFLSFGPQEKFNLTNRFFSSITIK